MDYPFHDWTSVVTRCGRVCFNDRKVSLSQVFAGQQVGVRQVTDRIWLVSFMDYDLGYFDDKTCRLEPIDNPFSPKVLRVELGRATDRQGRCRRARCVRDMPQPFPHSRLIELATGGHLLLGRGEEVWPTVAAFLRREARSAAA